MNKNQSLFDQDHAFGWISIVLHWVATVLIVALWLIGKSMSSLPPEAADTRLALHVNLGLTVWLLLVGRIAWRLRSGHPRATGQSATAHQIARLAHYLILVIIAGMIVSGPMMVWASSGHEAIFAFFSLVHGNLANLLFILIVLHIVAALGHLMFSDDDTIARIFVPPKKVANNNIKKN